MRGTHGGLFLGGGLLGLLLVMSYALADGFRGPVYLALYGTWLIPGLPVGTFLFGSRHPVAWISGAVIGYPLSALAFWVPIAFGNPTAPSFLVTWTAMSAVTWTLLWPRRGARVTLPDWSPRGLTALALLGILLLAVVGRPFLRIGEADPEGNRLYRAYFTADFLWHMALTAEVERYAFPPRNPYLAAEPLNYYWLYFVPPSVAATAAAPIVPGREARLAINALATGLLFLSSIYAAAWVVVRRTMPALFAVAFTLLAPSLEGTYALIQAWGQGQSIRSLRVLNVDAVTSWFFGGISIDGLQRAVMYNPQHSFACAAGLVALLVASAAGAQASLAVALCSGLALGLAVMLSPFPGAVLTLVFGLAVGVDALLHRDRLIRLVRLGVAAVPVVLALAWCGFNRTFEGAGGDVRFGLHRRALAAPLLAPALAVGSLLLLSVVGLAAHWRLPRAVRPSAVALLVCGFLLYFVTLASADIWVGWRAGQVLLVTAPALAALGVARLLDLARWRHLARAGLVCLLLAGLPTTVLDVVNAQDVGTRDMGPGFPWTVAINPDEQAALSWLRTSTRARAIVQMEPTVRGRESWTLIPSFAERRMAAGFPISLLESPAYAAAGERIYQMYRTNDADEAWRIARDFHINYIYIDQVERQHFPHADEKFAGRPDLFALEFVNAQVRVYRVR